MQEQKNTLTIANLVKVFDVLLLKDKLYFNMLPKLYKIIDNLMQTEQVHDYLIYQLKNKKRSKGEEDCQDKYLFLVFIPSLFNIFVTLKKLFPNIPIY